MENVLVSVTCPNCGNPVMFNLKTNIAGGHYGVCRNCSGGVSVIVSWDGNTPRIYGIQGIGGCRKK